MNEVATRPERHTAVIAFPLPKTRSVPPEPLDRALSGLLRASQEQRDAVAAWRAALVDLGRTMGELTASVNRYQAALADTGARVGTLGREARRQGVVLEALLDRSRTIGASG